MILDPMIFTAIGDVFLNLSAGWFGAVFIIFNTYPREKQWNTLYILTNIFLGIIALAIGYKFRILGI